MTRSAANRCGRAESVGRTHPRKARKSQLEGPAQHDEQPLATLLTPSALGSGERARSEESQVEYSTATARRRHDCSACCAFTSKPMQQHCTDTTATFAHKIHQTQAGMCEYRSTLPDRKGVRCGTTRLPPSWGGLAGLLVLAAGWHMYASTDNWKSQLHECQETMPSSCVVVLPLAASQVAVICPSTTNMSRRLGHTK